MAPPSTCLRAFTLNGLEASVRCLWLCRGEENLAKDLYEHTSLMHSIDMHRARVPHPPRARPPTPRPSRCILSLPTSPSDERRHHDVARRRPLRVRPAPCSPPLRPLRSLPCDRSRPTTRRTPSGTTTTSRRTSRSSCATRGRRHCRQPLPFADAASGRATEKRLRERASTRWAPRTLAGRQALHRPNVAQVQRACARCSQLAFFEKDNEQRCHEQQGGRRPRAHQQLRAQAPAAAAARTSNSEYAA